ncbi:hypothetical protein [Thiomicrorhabdus sp.]|uniref:hypothetical protein n=1 Tax=Thiomicrorhabdus sp. TaxID=2039724 RepID=UPI0029C98E1E|nr:hypothetical protein [Thiomicrorhabdus sp.]
MKRIFQLFSFCLLAIASQVFAQVPAGATEDQKLQQFRLLDIQLYQAQRDKLRQQLAELGGFKQSRATWGFQLKDRYFSRLQLPDSRYIVFHFDKEGRVSQFKRVFRNINSANIDLKQDQTGSWRTLSDIARDLVEQIGAPTHSQLHQTNGLHSYKSFQWHAQYMQISLDHLNHDPYAEPILSIDFTYPDENSSTAQPNGI